MIYGILIGSLLAVLSGGESNRRTHCHSSGGFLICPGKILNHLFLEQHIDKNSGCGTMSTEKIFLVLGGIMEQKVINAALEEMRIHAMKFTMEDLTRRLHISKTSLYKMVPSKDALIRGIVDSKVGEFRKHKEAILKDGGSADEKLLRLMHLYTDAFSVMGSHIASDLQSMYPAIWEEWRAFQRETVGTVIDLIRDGIATGVYRAVNLPVNEECLVAAIAAVSEPEFLRRNDILYRDAVEAVGDLFLYGLKKR